MLLQNENYRYLYLCAYIHETGSAASERVVFAERLASHVWSACAGSAANAVRLPIRKQCAWQCNGGANEFDLLAQFGTKRLIFRE